MKCKLSRIGTYLHGGLRQRLHADRAKASTCKYRVIS